MARNLKEISYEGKVKILETYQNRDVKTHDIPKMFDISQRTMQLIILELGGSFRHPNKAGTRTKVKTKTCPKCRQKVDIKGARFCPYCAEDLRSENEILAEKAESIKKLFMCIPETQRDFFIQTLCEVKSALLKGDK